MAEQVKIESEARTALGTRRARRLRQEGKLPVTVSAKGEDSLHLQVDERAFLKTLRTGNRIMDLVHPGGTARVFLRDIHWDHLGEKIHQLDFTKIDMDKELELEVELVLKGKPEGVVTEGGKLDQFLHTVQISCLPDSLPEKIEVDVEHLKLNEQLMIKDVTPPPGVKLMQPEDVVIAAISEPKEEEEVEPAEAEPGPAEPEVIKKEGAEAEGEEEESK